MPIAAKVYSNQYNYIRSFLDASILEAVVPEGAELDWISSLNTSISDEDTHESERGSHNANAQDTNIHHRNAGSSTTKSLATDVAQRQLLFIDEVVTLYVVLRVPYVDEDLFKAHLSDLTVSLDTHAIGTAPVKHDVKDELIQEQTHGPPVKDLVDSVTVGDSEEPIVAVETGSAEAANGDAGEEKRCIFVLWKARAHLNHARISSSNPHIYFTPSIHIKSRMSWEDRTYGDEYLPSGVPGSMNLLESLRHNRASGEHPPLLTTTRLAKVIPAGLHGDDALKPLKSSSRRLMRLAPALLSKIRFFGLGASPSQAKVLASIDVDIAQYTTGTIQLETMSLRLSDGRAETLTLDEEMALPHKCLPGNSLSFLYNLVPDHSRYSPASKTGIHSLNLELSANVTKAGKAPVKIRSAWKTNVNLSSFIKKPTLSQLPSPVSQHGAPSEQGSAPRAPVTQNILDHLLTVTVSGPSTVSVGEHLRWSLLFANRSSRRTLNLAVIPITHSSQAHATHATISHPTTASTAAQDKEEKDQDDPRSVAGHHGHKHKPTLSASYFHPIPESQAQQDASDERQHTQQAYLSLTSPATLSSSRPPGLLPLSADLRIGPLPPGASTTAEMRFLVLRPGVLAVEALRVVDLDGADTPARPASSQTPQSHQQSQSQQQQKRPASNSAATGSVGTASRMSVPSANSAGLTTSAATADSRAQGEREDSSVKTTSVAVKRRLVFVDIKRDMLPDVVAVAGHVNLSKDPGIVGTSRLDRNGNGGKDGKDQSVS